jgi:DNA-binding protein HU-beta
VFPFQLLLVSNPPLRRRGNADMNKAELIEKVAQTTEMNKVSAARAVEATLDVITSTLRSGDSVTLSGFGTFSITNRASRTGRNPRTGEPIPIAASKNPKFKAGKGLKDAVN